MYELSVDGKLYKSYIEILTAWQRTFTSALATLTDCDDFKEEYRQLTDCDDFK